MTETRCVDHLDGGVADLIAADDRLISNASKIRFFPFAPVTGDGCWLVDADGRRLLDFTAGWAVMNTGYGDKKVIEAVAEFASGSFPGLVSAVSRPAVGLAERLIELVSINGQPKVWFGHSGSDANEAAARLARRATGRRRLISFVGSYHGSTDGSAALSGHTTQARYADSGSIKIPFPNSFVPTLGEDAASDEAAILDYIEHYVLKTICPADDTAAVFIEAIQSDGGDLIPSVSFLAGLEGICRRGGILLVVDEVKVGLGRSGDWFSFQASGITPDLVILGKALGGGLPLSAIVGRRDVLDSGDSLALFTTAGNPTCCAAGIAVIESIEERALLANAKAMGEVLASRLTALSQRHWLIGDVRGRGLICGVELVRNRDSKEPAQRETAMVVFRAAELGLILFYCGLNSNVLELTPPLTITRDELDIGIELLDRAIADVENGRVSEDAITEYLGW
jgi:4-aminobutyrate aminotransferase